MKNEKNIMNLKNTLTAFIEGEAVLSIRKANTLKLILEWAQNIGFSYYRTIPKIPSYIKQNETYYVYIGRYLNSERRYILIRKHLKDVPQSLRLIPTHCIWLPSDAYNITVQTTNNRKGIKKEKVEEVKKEKETTTFKITPEEAQQVVQNSLKLIQALNNQLHKLL